MVRIVREPAKLSCLESVADTSQSWEAGSKDIRNEVTETLKNMQKCKCAYCEKRVCFNYHIEHFCEQSDCPERIFDWSNLFLSCNASRTCGRGKGKKKIEYEKNNCKLDYSKIVNPEKDEPREYFHFQLNGEIAPKEGINGIHSERAKYTIDVFQLNIEGLKNTRKKYISTCMEEFRDKHGEDLKSIRKKLIDDVACQGKKYEFSAWILAWLLGGN